MDSHHKKESEGIALLSIYGGDEDDEMEDVDKDEGRPYQQEGHEQQEQQEHAGTLIIEENSKIMISESPGNKNSSPFILQQQQVLNENITPSRVVNFGRSASVTTTPQHTLTSPQQQLPEQRRQKARLAIVDYGHDELAMSPEAEEGEIMASGAYGEELSSISGDFQERTVHVLTPSNQATPAQQAEPNDQAEMDAVKDAINESGYAEPDEAVMVPLEVPKDIDPLDKFLPPPPKNKCSDELQERIVKFLALKKTGRIYNAEVRNRKEYRNPDFLLHAVTYQDIDQIGSCLSKDVFDPHGYDKSDFYDEIEAHMRGEMQRKEEERRRSQKVDFISSGTQSGIVVPTPKINMLLPGKATVAGTGLTTISAAVCTVAGDGRQNKKSKWDKVDDDRKNPLPPGQDSVSAVAAHAALLSAANAGTGYSTFAQQRRREGEDKRSRDKKLDRRS